MGNGYGTGNLSDEASYVVSSHRLDGFLVKYVRKDFNVDLTGNSARSFVVSAVKFDPVELLLPTMVSSSTFLSGFAIAAPSLGRASKTSFVVAACPYSS